MRIRHAIVAVAITAAALTACTTTEHSTNSPKPKATASDLTQKQKADAALASARMTSILESTGKFKGLSR